MNVGVWNIPVDLLSKWGTWESGILGRDLGWKYKVKSHLHFGGMKAQGEITKARSTGGNGGLEARAGRPMRKVRRSLGER